MKKLLCFAQRMMCKSTFRHGNRSSEAEANVKGIPQHDVDDHTELVLTQAQGSPRPRAHGRQLF